MRSVIITGRLFLDESGSDQPRSIDSLRKFGDFSIRVHVVGVERWFSVVVQLLVSFRQSEKMPSMKDMLHILLATASAKSVIN